MFLANVIREFTTSTYIDIVLTLVLGGALVYVIGKFSKKNVFSYAFISLLVLKLIASIFLLDYLADLLNLLLFAVIAAFCVIYSQEIYRQLSALSSSMRKKLRFHEMSDDEQTNLIKELDNAVKILSADKTGAIITIERKDNLDHYIQSGEVVDAPVTAAMLCTIFYKGTPLHDGALIVRGNTIKAASVYFTPSVKALSGNYGARHRAGLGISEVCDAVTIIVSEQTGRVSISYNGELISINRDNFVEVITDYLKN